MDEEGAIRHDRPQEEGESVVFAGRAPATGDRPFLLPSDGLGTRLYPYPKFTISTTILATPTNYLPLWIILTTQYML